MPEMPQPIGPAVQFVVRRALLRHQHVEDKQELTERAARVRAAMIAREVRINAMAGMSPRLAEVAARQNLTLRLRELDEELAAELGRLQDEFHRTLAQLLEDLGFVGE